MNAPVTYKFLRTLPYSFYLKIFPLSLQPSMRSQISLSRFCEKSVSKYYMNRNVEIRVMNARVRKQFLRTLPFSCYLKKFPFSLQPSMRSPITLSRLYKKNVSKQLHEQKCGTLRGECTGKTEVPKNTSFQFLYEDIFFVTVALNDLPNITQQIP